MHIKKVIQIKWVDFLIIKFYCKYIIVLFLVILIFLIKIKFNSTFDFKYIIILNLNDHNNASESFYLFL